MDEPTIYHVHPTTREFMAFGLADPDPLEEGNWLVPACAYLDAPPAAQQGFAVVRSIDQNVWLKVEDQRGTVYCIHTGEALEYAELGALPVSLTTQPYPGEFHYWNEGTWVLDSATQLQAQRTHVLALRDERLVVAAVAMAPLQDAVELGASTEDEQALLMAWKHYRVGLGRIEQQDSFPASVVWPHSPDAARLS